MDESNISLKIFNMKVEAFIQDSVKSSTNLYISSLFNISNPSLMVDLVDTVCKSSFPLSRTQRRTQNSLSRGWTCLKVVAKMYLKNGQEQVKTLSIVRDLLSVASLFNIGSEFKNMVERDHVYEKSVWKKIIWDRAWSLEDTYWRIETHLKRELDILSEVNHSPRYSIWWTLSDNNHSCTYICETMARLTCHARLLKNVDLRLKSQSMAAKMCSMCDLAAVENVSHLVMQCPKLEKERANMFREIERVVDNFNNVVASNDELIINVLLGKAPKSIPSDKMVLIWRIAGLNIHNMYKLVIQRNEGIG